MKLGFTRRGILKATVAGTATAMVASPVWASQRSANLIIVHRAFLANEALWAAGKKPTKLVELELDVVWQWRSGLGAMVMKAGNSVAHVPWAEAHILASLVRENGGQSYVARPTENRFEVHICNPARLPREEFSFQQGTTHV